MWVFGQQGVQCHSKCWLPKYNVNCNLQSSLYSPLEVNSPYPVCGRRWDVDSECPSALLHFHSKQQGCVGHLLHLLLDELRLGGFLEILGLGYLVHKAHDLAGPVASHIATWAEDGKRGGEEAKSESGSSFIQNSISCYLAPTMKGSDWGVTLSQQQAFKHVGLSGYVGR